MPARVAGINLSTLKRWMRLPEFQAEFCQVGRDAMSQTNARINSGALASLGFKLAVAPRMPYVYIIIKPARQDRQIQTAFKGSPPAEAPECKRPQKTAPKIEVCPCVYACLAVGFAPHYFTWAFCACYTTRNY
jgi:hypothetical protein